MIKKIIQEYQYLDISQFFITLIVLSFIVSFFLSFKSIQKKRLLFFSLCIFFLIYGLLLSMVVYQDIKLQLKLFEFRGVENRPDNPEYNKVLDKLVNDTGRVFSFVTAIVPSFILSLFVYIFGKIYIFIKTRKLKQS